MVDRRVEQEQMEITNLAGTIEAAWDLKTLLRRINNLAYVESQQELVNQALDFLIEVTEADSATYFRLDVVTNELVVDAVRNDEDSLHLIGLRLKVQEAFIQSVMGDEQPTVIGDLPGDPRWLRAVSPTSAARMQNMISLPIVARCKLLGVCQVYNFKQVELDYLDLIRERLAVEFERKMTLDAAVQTNQRLHALLDVIDEIGGTLDRKQIMQTVLEQSASLVGAERSSIFLVDPGTNEIAFQVAYQSTPAGSKRLSELDPVKRKPTLFTRSAITVPIQMQSSLNNQDEKIRSMGGLMALNPFDGSFTAEDGEILEALVKQTSNFLQAAEIFENVEELFLDIIKALVTAIDAKDPYTQGHSHRVSEYSVLIAQELGLSSVEINNIRVGSLLHDVGKIGMPDSILMKKGKLTPEEWHIMKNHPLTGWNILQQVRLLEHMLPAIIEHHEKLDGSGYPYGLSGNQISLMGRIVAVADVFDAMTSDRPYRDALSIKFVMEYLAENTGTLFDIHCVNALKEIVYRSADEDLMN